MRSKSLKGKAGARKSDAGADPVSEFYTHHPYPPPVENLDRLRDAWQAENPNRAEYHLLWPNKEYRSDLDVLIAGCGTWQAAKYAICHPNARVTGVDVSPTSLEHTETLKRKHNLTNLVTRQLPIEKVAGLDKSFDLIVCTGVLHHLADPDAGLRALRSVLNPEGAMDLMVYAPYGRTGVYMLQEYCRRIGVGTSEEEIHDLTTALKLLPEHHPLLATMRGSRDSLNAEALVDTLLHPRDRAYSAPELFDFIERNDLTPGRWRWQAPYLPQCGLIAETPHANRLIALPERERYRAMELWRGLMTIHSLVVYRSDVNNDGLKVRFDDERYLRYAPIRLPWTICVQEELPPGVSGILFNQTHVFDDLMLFIDAREKRIFEAIDGRRSVSEILDEVKEKEASPSFFEKLWWYDQVVFDTSKAQ
ncbi:MAG TPA: class I SAM-dependent methyltransferase [Blastocatellia bacterium]|nr:class I SAM-dependent methyltransferase [Blastocatellia bacterium]